MKRIRNVRCRLKNKNFKLQVSRRKCNGRIQRFASRKGEAGFTLLELMISISMLVIIVVIIGGTMRLGSRSVAAGEKKIESLERMRASLNLIDAQIQSITPLTYVEDAVKKFYFKGERDLLQFSSNYSVWLGQRGYVIAVYRVETDNYGKQTLFLSENIIGLEAKRETKLIESSDGIYFDYFIKEPTEEKGQWVEKWADENNIPDKIRLHLVTGRQELVMLIPVRTKGNPAASR